MLAFKPEDVFPCTVDEKTWDESVSMKELFGHLCSTKQFVHDRHMREARGENLEHENKRARYTVMRDARRQLQAMGSGVHFSIGSLPRDANEVLEDYSESSYQTTRSHSISQEYIYEDQDEQAPTADSGRIVDQHTGTDLTPVAESESESKSQQTISDLAVGSQETESGEQGTHHLSRHDEAYQNRLRAYQAARTGTFDAWNDISIVSAGNNHAEEEAEL